MIASTIVQAARQLIGKPFRHRGRGPVYYDCGGVVAHACIAAGIVPHDIALYGREPHNDGLRSAMVATFGDPVDAATMRAGDVLLMRFVEHPHHLAIVGDHPAGGLSMIHADGSVGRVVEHRIDSMWAGRIIEVYRWHA